MNIEQAFGIVLREKRNQMGYTQEVVAEKANLHRTFISLLERGERKPTIETVFSLSEVLGIKPSEFIQEVEELLKK